MSGFTRKKAVAAVAAFAAVALSLTACGGAEHTHRRR